MLPEVFQVITAIADIAIFIYVGLYLLRLHKREKLLDKKERQVDTDYHEVVDNALNKERRILEDATDEAGEIISGAEYISKSSRDAIHDALRTMILDIQKEAGEITHNFNITYANSLKQLTAESLGDFQAVSKELQTDLELQIKTFRESLLPSLEKELEEYKQSRLQQTEKIISSIIQRVSLEVLHKSLSLADHQNLIIESLEKAKKEGVFE